MFISKKTKLLIVKAMVQQHKRIEELEKKVADLERETQSQQKELENKYGIILR